MSQTKFYVIVQNYSQQFRQSIKPTFWLHADFQALLISTSLANTASFGCNRTIAVLCTVILQTITLFDATSEETLHTSAHSIITKHARNITSMMSSENLEHCLAGSDTLNEFLQHLYITEN